MRALNFTKSIRRLSFMLAMALLPLSGYCAGATTGTLSSLLIQGNNPDRLFIYMTGGTAVSPSPCGTAGNYILDISTSTGKAMYAWLLGAKMSGAAVTMYGWGTCNMYGGFEDARAVAQ